MKLMKKALVLALAAAILLPMTGCKTDVDSGSPAPATQEGTGTNDTTTSGGGTNGGNDVGAGAGTSTNGYVAPTLPENKGSDPFAGLAELTWEHNPNTRYLVDTTKRTLTHQYKQNDGSWKNQKSYRYSYDSTTTPATITMHIHATPIPPNGDLVTVQEYLNKYTEIQKTELEERVKTTINMTDKESQIEYFNGNYGLSLTAADFTEEKKAATLEAIWNSPGYQDHVARLKKNETTWLQTTKSYHVTLSNQSGTSATIAFGGHYDDSRPWYLQNDGEFADETRYAVIGRGEGRLLVHDEEGEFVGEYRINFPIDSNVIKCRNMHDGTESSFPYTTAGSGKDMTVTINANGTNITLRWVPSSEILIL